MSNKINKGMDELKRQWKKELWYQLFDNFTNCEYHGYNNIKPLFNNDYVLEFDLSEKLQVQLRNGNLPHTTFEYSDEWFLTGDYDINILRDNYNLIWNTEKFKELRKFVVNFYSELINFTSELVNNFDANDELIDNDIIKEQLNIFLNEKLV